MDIAQIAGELLGPLVIATESPANLEQVLGQLGQLTTAADDLLERVRTLLAVDDLAAVADLLRAFADPNDAREPGELIGALIPRVDAVVTAVQSLASLGAGDLAGLAAPFDEPATWRAIGLALPGYLLGRWLADDHPTLAAALALLGLTREVETGGAPPVTVLDLAAVGDFLQDPSAHVSLTYGWGGDLDSALLLDRLQDLGVALGCRVARRSTEDVPDELSIGVIDGLAGAGGYVQLGLRLTPLSGAAGGLTLTVEHSGDAPTGVALGDAWTSDVAGAVTLDGQGIDLRPTGVTHHGDGAPRLTLTGRPATPWVPLGAPGGARVELAGVEVSLAADTIDGEADVRLSIQLGTSTSKGLRIIVDPSSADSFLASLVPVEIAVDTALAAEWSRRAGAVFGGSVGWEVIIPLGLRIGPVEVDQVRVTVTGAESGVAVTAAATLTATLGPFVVVVDGLGLLLLVEPATNDQGWFGPFDIVVLVRPPDGLGVAIDIGVVSGGGFLYIEPDGTGYAGVLELGLLGIRISAIGLVDTAVPGGGWSLFLALFIDVPAIQLGFGFTLTGVGGLAGVNRTLDEGALRAAVRSGALDDVLFPANPIADAPIIIQRMESIFPSAQGRYTFGPVVRIGWGTPTLVEAELGIVISLPDPIVVAVLGSISSVLPTADLDLVALNLDVAGIVDTGAQTLTIDASLHDSHVIGFALSGDMALRANFSDLPFFLFSLGGYHPAFTAQPGFPKLRRLSLAISAGPIQVHFGCYFAIASNTVQFGSRFELSASIEGFGIEGGAEFDAVIQFSPFVVMTHLGFHVAITAAGVDLVGVWLDAKVIGPNPWRITGVARFRLLGFEEEISVDERIGRRQAEPAVEAADLRQLVRDALADPGAWSVVSTGDPAVTVTAVELAPDELVADPSAVFSVAQQAAPLGITLDRAGDAPTGLYDLFTLQATAGGLVASGDVLDWFAPGYFLELTPTEGLSSPSFELLAAGIELGGGDTVAGPDRPASLDFEQILLDPELAEAPVLLHPLDLGTDLRYGGLGGMAAATRHAGYHSEPEGDAVSLIDPGFSVTDRLTGAVLAAAPTWSACHQSPARRGGGSLVPTWEATS